MRPFAAPLVAVRLALGLCGLAAAGEARAEACAPASGRLAAPGPVFAALLSPDGCWLFASLGGPSPGVAVFRLRQGAFSLERTLILSAPTRGLALTHDGAVLAAASGDALLLLDAARLKTLDQDPVLASVAEVPTPVELALSPDDALLFAALEQDREVLAVDVAKARAGRGREAVVGRVPAPAPSGLAVSADGRRLYVATLSTPAGYNFPARCLPYASASGPLDRPEGALMIIDLARSPDGRPRMDLIRQAPAGCSPSRVALAPDGRSAWVSARGEDALFGFDLNAEGTFVSALVRHRIPVGPAPTGLAIDRDGRAWVAASNRFRPSEPGEIDHLSLTPPSGSQARIARSPSGRFPRDVSLLPGGGAAVALFGSSGVELLTGP